MNPQRPRPSTEQVSKVFRGLADRHAEERSRLSVERSWNRLQSKLLARSGGAVSGRLRVLGRPALGLLGRLTSGVRAFSPALVAAACLLTVGLAGLGLGAWSPWANGSFWGNGAFWRSGAQASLSYEVLPLAADRLGSGVHHVLQADGWLRTDSSGAQLAFSDGSRIEMSEQSALRLQVTGEHGAEGELSQGQLRADILHTDTTRWALHAGPYRVDVVGTQFDLAYGAGGFSIVMHAGRVRVTAPQGRSWTLDAGQNLNLPREATAEAAVNQAGEASAIAVPAAPEAADAEQPASPRAAMGPDHAPLLGSHKARAGTLSEPQKSWPELVAKGQFQRVLDEAKALGAQFPGPQASEAQVAAVAQAAGYSGDARFAERCWRYLRAHHARSAGSARAAFYLARIAEQRGELKDALDWLGVYNKESPGGAFSAEALGRQLLILRRIDPSAPRAVDAAREYLRRFPEGAHREAAQATLGISAPGSAQQGAPRGGR